MADESECKLTGRRCYRTSYGGDRCSDDPTPDEAADCIQTLDEKRIELEKELAEMDQWIEQVKARAADKPDPSGTKH